MRVINFGAGNIGKGFIGYLLHRSGYDVCFVDVNEDVINRLNTRNQYLVKLLDDTGTTEVISPVSAKHIVHDEEALLQEIESAALITTATGVQNLSKIAGTLAKGLLRRVAKNKQPLDVIANENAIFASDTLKSEVEKHVSSEEMAEILSVVRFPNSAIDRLALPREHPEDELAVVEPDFEWVVEETGNHQAIEGVTYVEDLKPYIERKLFSINMAHAATAYLAHLCKEPTIQSALTKSRLKDFVHATMLETARYIENRFRIPAEEMEAYIQKTLRRFQNPNIEDDIYRVGRSPIRKLGPDERLNQPLRQLQALDLPADHLIFVVAAGFHFYHPDDEESVTLQDMVKSDGIESAIQEIAGIHDRSLLDRIQAHYSFIADNKDHFTPADLPVLTK